MNSIATHIGPAASREAVKAFCTETGKDIKSVSRYRFGSFYDTGDIVFDAAGALTALPTSFFTDPHATLSPRDWWTNAPGNGQMPGTMGMRIDGMGVQILLRTPGTADPAAVAAAMQSVATAYTLRLNIGQDNDQRVGPALAWMAQAGGFSYALGAQAGGAQSAFAIGGVSNGPNYVPWGKPLNVLPSEPLSVAADTRAGIIPTGVGFEDIGLSIRVSFWGTLVYGVSN